ncbi:MAG: hypothetical protein P8X58_04660 [Syntrophobacterales bacterium]
MDNSKKKGKQTQKSPADSPKIPKILAEARQMVDDLGREATPSKNTPPKKEASGRKTRAKTGATKKPVARKKAPAAKKKASPHKAPPSPARTTATVRALPKPPRGPAAGPRLSPAECGIRVVHVLPGRIRFRVYSLKYNVEFAREVEKKLAAITGVTGVEASPSTGSLLMQYRSKELLAGPLREALETWFPRLDTDSLLASLPA